jgi:hypothetical protein
MQVPFPKCCFHAVCYFQRARMDDLLVGNAYDDTSDDHQRHDNECKRIVSHPALQVNASSRFTQRSLSPHPTSLPKMRPVGVLAREGEAIE